MTGQTCFEFSHESFFLQNNNGFFQAYYGVCIEACGVTIKLRCAYFLFFNADCDQKYATFRLTRIIPTPCILSKKYSFADCEFVYSAYSCLVVYTVLWLNVRRSY